MRQLLPLLGFLALVVGYTGAARRLRTREGRPGWASWLLLVLVAVPSLLQQLVAPRLLDVLGRQSVQVLQHHQYWRLVTSVVVQDGGWPGTVLNLVLLAVTVPVAERVWGSGRTGGTFLVAGVLLDVAAVGFGVDGAGNSGATLALGSSLLVPAFVQRRWAPLLLGLLGGAVLVVAADEHWVAVVMGLVLGAALTALAPVRPGARTG